jgi:hypothetical protein
VKYILFEVRPTRLLLDEILLSNDNWHHKTARKLLLIVAKMKKFTKNGNEKG